MSPTLTNLENDNVFISEEYYLDLYEILFCKKSQTKPGELVDNIVEIRDFEHSSTILSIINFLILFLKTLISN